MPDVLLQQCSGDRRQTLQRAAEHRDAADSLAGRRPPVEHLDQLVPRDAERFTQLQRADRTAQIRAEQQVVQDLRALPGAEWAEVHDRVGVRGEHRPAPFDHLLLAADHDQQRALLDCGAAAGHRRIDDRDALCTSLFSDLAARVGVDCAVDGDDASFGESGQHAVVPVEHLPDVVVTDNAQAHQIAGRGHVRRRRSCLRRSVRVRLQAGLSPGPQRGLEAALGDSPSHGPALAAQSDESDAHQLASTCFRSRPLSAMHSSRNDNTLR